MRSPLSIEKKCPYSRYCKNFYSIVQFERGQHDPQRLYSRLFAHNQNLALWLRRRAAELAPDVEDREEMTTLALELAGILANQAAINDLNELLSGRRGK
jgi:hypothetical protein